MTIGKSLAEYWKETTLPLQVYLDIDPIKQGRPIRTPLEHFLKYNYKERHIALCQRLGIAPLSFGAWLRKDVNTLI